CRPRPIRNWPSKPADPRQDTHHRKAKDRESAGLFVTSWLLRLGLVLRVERPDTLAAVGHLVPALVAIGVAAARGGRTAAARARSHRTAGRGRAAGRGGTRGRVTRRGTSPTWRAVLRE